MILQPDRLPPHDLSAEVVVIGSILIGGENVSNVYVFLKPEDFYREAHRFVYEAALALFHRGEPVDLISISHELYSKDRLELVGGAEFLNNTLTVVPTSLHIEHYGRIVHRTATMRKLIEAGNKIAKIGYEYEDSTDVTKSIRGAEYILDSVRSRDESRDFVHIRDILDKGFSDIVTDNADNLRSQPLNTGFRALDSKLGGLYRSDMIVLAARPSVGKSMLALNIALNVAQSNRAGTSNEKNRVAIFSLEMSVEQVVFRLLSTQSRVEQTKVRDYLTISRNALNESEEARLIDASGLLSDIQIFIDDTPFQTITEMRAKSRQLEIVHGIDFIVIDYMQLIDGGSSRIDVNRAQIVSEISRNIKGMARDMDIPILALSQLNRAIEQRQSSPRPLLSDLRESGSIEQDADIVIFIHREDKLITEEQWNQRYAKSSDQSQEKPYPKGIVDLLIAKHRHGPVGDVKMIVKEDMGQFHDLSSVQYKNVEVVAF